MRRQNMPVIASARGIKVMMYFNDHAPPHVHVEAGGDIQVVIDVLDPKLPSGLFSKTGRKELLAWVRRHETALLANWTRARMGLPLERIEMP